VGPCREQPSQVGNRRSTMMDYHGASTAERSCPVCGTQMLLTAITPIFFMSGEQDRVAKFSCATGRARHGIARDPATKLFAKRSAKAKRILVIPCDVFALGACF
jgi:hypothetical protein